MHSYRFVANSSQSDTAYNLFKTRLNGSNSVFKSIETFSTNQVQKSHIRMVHKVSGIRCSLHFNSQELGKSAEIILQLIKFNPMGKRIATNLFKRAIIQIF